MPWLGDWSWQVGFTHDHAAAYLFCVAPLRTSVTARWIHNRPDLTTFDPARWRLGSAVAARGGTVYDATPMTKGIYRGI